MPTKILTHGDVDGVISATLISLMDKGEIYFTHPIGILKDLREFASYGDKIYILDIALDEKSWRELVKTLNEYGEHGYVIYFDHHPKPYRFREDLFTNIIYIHEEGRSTSELVHKYYREKLPLESSRLALFGGIGDYSDETEYMRKLYSYWDKRMIYFEAGLLAQALETSRGLYDFKRMVIRKLIEGYIPSQIPDLVERAVKMSDEEENMRNELKNQMKIMKYISYVINPRGSVTRAARYLIGLSGKVAGLAVEEREDVAVISARARRDSVDLNKVIRKVSVAYGGSGGGHPNAAGARIPRDSLEKFLETMDREVGKQIRHREYPLHIAP